MISLQTLGGLDLRRDGTELRTVLSQPKRLAVLIYLATANPRGFHARDTLLSLFWPEADSERARNALRQTLHFLRRELGDGVLVGRGDREVGVDAEQLVCDAAAFDRAVETGDREQALGLYRGDFLPGYFVQDAPDAERWIESERTRRRRVAVETAWRLSEDQEKRGDLPAAARSARRAAALEPTDEPALRRLLGVLDRAGEPAAALEAYFDFAKRVKAEFGIAPSAETAQLVRSLKARARVERDVEPGPMALIDTPGADLTPASVGEPLAPGGALVEGRPASRWSVVAFAAALAVVAAGGYWLLAPRDRERGSVRETPSIAVLPFVNMSGDSAYRYFSDGMSEELLNLLAQVPGLHVAARTSSFSFRDKNLPVDSIARVLRVRHVLEGSVRSAGDRVRITAQLIDARTGYHIWSGNFDRRLEDVFQVQDSIGRVIVETLRPRLASGAPAATLARREPSDPRAHVAVLKGWRVFRQNTPDAWVAAVGHFEEALRRDSLYAPAYAGLANVKHWQASFRQLPPEPTYREAEALARRALALDSTVSEAYLVLGRIADVRDRDFSRAASHYAQAIELSPSDPRAYGRRAPLLVRLGRHEEALASAKRAVELDPASPAVYSDLAATYDALNRTKDQESAIRQALALDPGHPILLGNLSMNLAYQKRFAEAESALVEARKRTPKEANLLGRHAFLSARLGRTERARALLDTAVAAGLSKVNVALTWLELGDRERALDLLEQAVRDRDDNAVSILDPAMFPSLRDDPRYRKLVEEVKGRR